MYFLNIHEHENLLRLYRYIIYSNDTSITPAPAAAPERPSLESEGVSILQEAARDGLAALKKAYNKLALIYHPDKYKGSGNAAEIFGIISVEYNILYQELKHHRM